MTPYAFYYKTIVHMFELPISHEYQLLTDIKNHELPALYESNVLLKLLDLTDSKLFYIDKYKLSTFDKLNIIKFTYCHHYTN